MEKVMYVVRDPARGHGDGLRDGLVGATERFVAAGALAVTVDVDDSQSDVPPALPAPEDEPTIRAVVSVWLHNYQQRGPVEALLDELVPDYDGYLVVESLYTDYGGNAHAAPRDWPDGERSPGLLTVTCLEQAADLTYEAWIEHWHGYQSPMSEEMQPRSRYVRNEVVRPLTPDARPWKAIVEEAWPSAEHVTDPFLFYTASSQEELDANIGTMVTSVSKLTDLGTLRVNTMSEYLLKSLPLPG